MSTSFISYLKLLRVHQWIKNFFIFAPIFFSFSFHSGESLINASIAFIGFCCIASSIYIINDWKDIESDKQHPKKKFRPLASGAIRVGSAFIVCLFLVVLGFGIYIFFLKSIASANLLAAYFLLNLAYCFKLKQISIVDITIVSVGFVIRLFIGGYATGIVLSYWIIILTFLLALLLVVGKRRTDVVIFSETGKQMRKSIAGYNLEFLNSIIVVIVAIIIFSYIMYTISPIAVLHNGEYLYITSLFVILGLFRYLQAIFVEKKGDSPTNLLIQDRFLQIDIILWGICFLVVRYCNQL